MIPSANRLNISSLNTSLKVRFKPLTSVFILERSKFLALSCTPEKSVSFFNFSRESIVSLISFLNLPFSNFISTIRWSTDLLIV